MKKGLFGRLFGPRRRDTEREYDYEREFQEEPTDIDNESLLVDHQFRFFPAGDYERHIGSMAYEIKLENTTDYPIGKLKLEFDRGSKLGKFGNIKEGKRMLDPGENAEFEVPFKPGYVGGKEEFTFHIHFFDFRYKVDEKITLKTEPIKVLVPKFKGLDLDEDGYRILTADLYRWTVETDVLKIPARELFAELTEKLDELGFSEADSMENEALYRGIRKMVATDKKGRKWAVQIQVIGDDKESKLLIYSFGERPQNSYSLATRLLHKFPRREEIVDKIIN
jgi:hypothetical protein